MAVQKRRQSSARRDSRRAQWMRSVKKPTVQRCPKCQAPKPAHSVCAECGFYRDREIKAKKPKAADQAE
jgi:large subunit ribosomal protein L32